jgi:hypothetical protein
MLMNACILLQRQGWSPPSPGRDGQNVLSQDAAKTPRSAVTASFVIPMRKTYWTREEDEKLAELVQTYGAENWTFIASEMTER